MNDNEVRLIDANALKKAFEEERQYLLARGQTGAEHIIVHHCLSIIDNAPTANDWEQYSTKLWKEAYEQGKADRPQGEWIKNEHTFWTCSHCNWFNEMNRIKYNFCPNCGAKMKGGEGE